MTESTVNMVIEWLDKRNEQQLAKWMSKTLHLGTVKQCLALIVEAKQIHLANNQPA